MSTRDAIITGYECPKCTRPTLCHFKEGAMCSYDGCDYRDIGPDTDHLIDSAKHAAREQQRHMAAERAMQQEIERLRQGIRDAVDELNTIRVVTVTEETGTTILCAVDTLESLLESY